MITKSKEKEACLGIGRGAAPSVRRSSVFQTGMHGPEYSMGFADGLGAGEHLARRRWLWRGFIIGVLVAIPFALVLLNVGVHA